MGLRGLISAVTPGVKRSLDMISDIPVPESVKKVGRTLVEVLPNRSLPLDIARTMVTILPEAPLHAPTWRLRVVGTRARGLKLIVHAEEESVALKRDARQRIAAATDREEMSEAAIAYLKTISEVDLERIGWEELRMRSHDGEDVADPAQVIDVNDSGNPIFSTADPDTAPLPLNVETSEHVVPEGISYEEPDYAIDPDDTIRKEMMDGFELRKLTEMAYALYGKTGVEKITELFAPRRDGNKAAAIRAFFEGFSGDQCQGVLGGTARQFKPGKSLCWICGFVIPVGATSGYKMECEHVFPIAQAIYFVDLYRGRETNPDSINKLYYEYDWSHRVCNQIKNNKHFIRPGTSNEERWVIAEDAEFTSFLNELYDRSGVYFNGVPDQLRADIKKKGKSEWLIAQASAVKKRCIETLSVGLGGCYPGIFDLIKVASCLDMYDREIVKREQLDAALEARGRPRRAQSAPRGSLAPAVIAPPRSITAPRARPVPVQSETPQPAPPVSTRSGRTVKTPLTTDFVMPKGRGMGSTPRARKNRSVVTRSMARRTKRNAK